MASPRGCVCVATALVVVACGGGAQHRTSARPAHHGRPAGPASSATRVTQTVRATQTRRAREATPAPQALVAAETVNRVLALNLRNGTVTGHLAIAGGPQYVDGDVDQAVVSSPQTGTVTVLTGPHWRVRTVLHGFRSPHIVAISPDGDHAFVTDDRRGTLSVIRLTDDRVTATLHVGAGAHHLAASPDQHVVWVALGERAHTIVMVDTSDIDHPAVIGRFQPDFAAHDLAFSPDGRRVWVTSAAGPEVSVLDARDHRLLFRVRVGAPPQHVAFLGAFAYLTSGYDSTIERVTTAFGRGMRRASTPYGSFELSAAAGYVVTASLLDGRMAVFTPALRLLRVRTVAPATRDVAVIEPVGAP